MVQVAPHLARVTDTHDADTSRRPARPPARPPGAVARKQKSLPLAERECIPTHQVIDVLESLSSTLIFNSANKEEKLALASRLRHWVVEDGTYLIREGDGDRNRSAIFVIGE